MKIVFIENYGVSKAQVIIPATDISEQISTAGKEASGTSNMKFMMNGALTLGTLDGANVEIAKLVGADNIVIFGLKADEADSLRYSGTYSPWDIYNSFNPAKVAIDSLIDGSFDKDPERFRLIYDEIMDRNDEYFILKDFQSYLEATAKMDNLYADRVGWGKKCLVNVAESGYFSSDRTIGEYNRDIWHLPKVV
jgi:starch phosphorylase